MGGWRTWAAVGLAAIAAGGLPRAAPPPPAAHAAPEEAAGPLTLADALALALLGNPALRAFAWETRAAEAHALQAGKLENPEIEIRFQSDDAPAAADDESRRRVMFSQELEFGGKLGRRVELAEAERRVADRDYALERCAVIRDATSAFATALGAQRQAAAWQRFVAVLEQTAARVSSLVQGGFAGVVEEHRVTRQLGLARIEAQAAEARLSAARFALAATWGRSTPRFTAVVGRLDPPGPLPPPEVLLERLERSPPVARAEAERAREQAALALARAERFPDLELGAGVRWSAGVDERDYLLDLGIELPVFDRNQGAILEARHRLAGAEARRQGAAAAGAAALAEAYFAAAEAAGRARALEHEVVPAARATFEAHRAAFEAQTRGGVGDLIDAGRDLARAESDLAGALAEAHRTRAALEGLLGEPVAAE